MFVCRLVIGVSDAQAMLDWKERTVEQQLPSFAPSRQREQELWQLGYRRVAGARLVSRCRVCQQGMPQLPLSCAPASDCVARMGMAAATRRLRHCSPDRLTK